MTMIVKAHQGSNGMNVKFTTIDMAAMKDPGADANDHDARNHLAGDQRTGHFGPGSNVAKSNGCEHRD
jgi:hypothetical protein